MPYESYNAEDIERRGEAIFDEQIRPVVEQDNVGRFVVIDVETGEYEMDDDDVVATRRALAKRPQAVLYGVRVGFPTAYSLGGKSLSIPQQ